MRKIIGAALIVAAMAAAVSAEAADTALKPPKAYVIGEVNVTDAQTYKTYAAKTSPIVAKFGGIYIARGGQTVPVEGAGPAGRVVVIEFPSLAAAKAFEASAEYLKVAPIRQRSSTGRFFIVEGTAP
ncbi:MAG: DUF1330 domain-containing protein [Alphaproteobacteria bacterium]|nr:DUF1330 domain-containing protein [Alphaproteobacteria bacterium]